ncbi:MAG: SDR family NAD(P)-dependent oxidoreductase [Acidobacteria bacterium]|nr:SDR family NAD(P)-dependent oxidoreductase [Acidobacteriota bacterium]
MSRVAIVTGGARGIGRACAHGLAETGYDVALVDLLVPEMERTAGEIRERGRRALVFEGDVADFERAHTIVGDVRTAWGRVDFLLNNAGGPNPLGILEIREADFDRTIAVNLKSCFNFIHAVAPVMLAQETGGRIANMSSLNAISGGVTSAVSKHAYAAAKAGIIGLTRSLAKELGPTVMVNAICPGVIKTELGNSLTRSREPELVKGIALGRLGSPADVAQLVVFLATAEPCFITGQHFVVDGFQWCC